MEKFFDFLAENPIPIEVKPEIYIDDLSTLFELDSEQLRTA
jgi:hypothetical protein